MKSRIEKLQELDDELKKAMQEVSDKVIDRETAEKKIAKIRKEIKILMSEMRSDNSSHK